MVSFVAVVAGAVLAGAVLAQADPIVACRVCSNQGSVPCGRHGKPSDREQPAHGTVFCSVATECKLCGGALAQDCKTCSNTAVERRLEQRRQLAKQWLQKRRADVDALADNEPLLHLETTHVDLVFSLRPATVGKDKLDTHALMHLYGDRIEALRTMFMQLLEIPESDFSTRLRVFMFRDAQDHSRVGPRVTGIGTANSSGVKLMGVEAVYSMWQDPRSLPDDEAVHRNIAHHVAHLLVCNAAPAGLLGSRKHGWIDEGLAHWFEDKVTGKCANYCFEEVALQPGAGFKGGRWRAPVRRIVDEGKCRPFAELSALNADQLEFQDHALAFAYVDFLLTTRGGAKFRDLVRLVKKGELRDALQAVYGLSPLTIEPQFQQWVKTTYSPLDPR
jgi:hypothetical protein